MKKGGRGGVKTQTGLTFEKNIDIYKMLSRIPGYEIIKSPKKAGVDILYNKTLVGRCFRKNEFYKFLKENNINWKEIISKKYLPDDSILVIVRETIFIIEIKYQQISGSTDEKLQTCDFKRKIFQKLVKPLNLKVEYVYVLNNWFKKPIYKDVLEYIESVNCHYKFNELPLAWLGLPAG
ncbi:MAG: hypothetical protein N2321_01935 [Melioribacteraceae bacterium]|nr:hypothetical protein [Melioribacteraceae bacterium]